MVKILLTSDIHLGSEIERSPVPENFRLKTFKKLSYLAKSHDLFIIAGDLFHHKGINDRTVDFVASEFNSLREAGVEIIYILGENELGESDRSFLSKLSASKIFSDNESISPYKFAKNNQEIYIYGLPAYSKRDISEIKKISNRGFHIGLFHADFYFNEENKTTNIRLIDKEDIISLNLDFYALGHNHQFKLFKSDGRYIGAYPGSPEAVSFNEEGDRYTLSFAVKDNKIYQIKRLTVNSAKIENIAFDCGLSNDPGSLMRILRERKSGSAILKILLTGRRDFKFDHEEINKLKNEYLAIHIEDKSSPAINLFTGEFAGEESLRGEFFSILDRKIKNDELPPNIDINILSDIINKVINSGFYTLEDLCNYWNA